MHEKRHGWGLVNHRRNEAGETADLLPRCVLTRVCLGGLPFAPDRGVLGCPSGVPQAKYLYRLLLDLWLSLSAE